MKINKIKLKRIKELLQKLPRVLGENFLLTFLGLFFISLIAAGLVFYRYEILVEKAKPAVSEKPLQFEEKTYENILKIWQEREKRFKEIDSKKYPNPFYSATSTALTK